ncbi:MAG: winged helix-turn-helix transcriptional regulator [Proteobacteria bacterium]|nr:winged helix-turn-helix transcriptional regulator [Pseudomonadota bacterium]
MNLHSLPCYCATLRQAARAVTSLYESVLAGTGLHATQFTALQVLERVPGLTTTEVAEVIGIDQTTATRSLGLIKKAGLAVDTVGSDRRLRKWTLTPLGGQQLKKLSPKWEAAQAEFERRVGKPQALALRKASFEVASRLDA